MLDMVAVSPRERMPTLFGCGTDLRRGEDQQRMQL